MAIYAFLVCLLNCNLVCFRQLQELVESFTNLENALGLSVEVIAMTSVEGLNNVTNKRLSWVTQTIKKEREADRDDRGFKFD